MPHDNSAQVDVSANRSASKWTPREKLGRVLWGGAAIVFRLVPRPLWGIRRAMLRAFGAKIGANVHIHPTVRIFIPWNITIHDQAAIGDRAILYALGPITIGARSTVSQGAHLCAGSHDWRDPHMPLLKHPIVIGEDAWVAADAFVGPNVVIGPRAIVGARSVVMKPVDADHIVAGNPARLIGHRPVHGPQA